ncbi:hypothetical protein BKA70DRAFT_1226792 [Coprinopsis sp. MPI-PUGE-AT-0042]|nr:hypothetical protein BKA70DRAFT_1226792 [Coprinopsis sp. MPI-PUGE-AT-0042]
MNGPLYWEIPTPTSCKITDIKDRHYILPAGRLRSEYILTLARSALKYLANALEDYKAVPPIELFATIMAALEHAAIIVDQYGDKSKKVTPFSKTSWGAQMKHYVGNLEGVNFEKWEEVLEAYNSSDSEGHGLVDSSSNKDMGQQLWLPPLKQRLNLPTVMCLNGTPTGLQQDFHGTPIMDHAVKYCGQKGEVHQDFHRTSTGPPLDLGGV